MSASAPELAELGGGLRVRWSAHRQFYVENLYSIEIDTADEAIALVQRGLYRRYTASHAMNSMSSRSHALLTVEVHAEDPQTSQITRSRLHLIDLAGSERITVTEAHGKVLKQSIAINRSLFVLRQVLTSLASANDSAASSGATSVAPYRDSVLTKLLRSSLCVDAQGNGGLLLMIACIYPNDENTDESIATLSYAALTKRIKQRVRRNQDPMQTMLEEQKRLCSMHLAELDRAYRFIAMQQPFAAQDQVTAELVAQHVAQQLAQAQLTGSHVPVVVGLRSFTAALAPSSTITATTPAHKSQHQQHLSPPPSTTHANLNSSNNFSPLPPPASPVGRRPTATPPHQRPRTRASPLASPHLPQLPTPAVDSARRQLADSVEIIKELLIEAQQYQNAIQSMQSQLTALSAESQRSSYEIEERDKRIAFLEQVISDGPPPVEFDDDPSEPIAGHVLPKTSSMASLSTFVEMERLRDENTKLKQLLIDVDQRVSELSRPPSRAVSRAAASRPTTSLTARTYHHRPPALNINSRPTSSAIRAPVAAIAVFPDTTLGQPNRTQQLLQFPSRPPTTSASLQLPTNLNLLDLDRSFTASLSASARSYRSP